VQKKSPAGQKLEQDANPVLIAFSRAAIASIRRIDSPITFISASYSPALAAHVSARLR
jgi:hypothetical protein